jgi:hypothetical protein
LVCVQSSAAPDKEEPFEFPVPYLYELENRVFTESWSIPYKREESLGRCLLAANRLAQEGNAFCDNLVFIFSVLDIIFSISIPFSAYNFCFYYFLVR